MNDVVKTDDDLFTITSNSFGKLEIYNDLANYFYLNFPLGVTNFLELGKKLLEDDECELFFLLCGKKYNDCFFKLREKNYFDQYFDQIYQILAYDKIRLSTNKIPKMTVEQDCLNLLSPAKYGRITIKGDETRLTASGDFSLVEALGIYSEISTTGYFSQIISKSCDLDISYMNISSSGSNSQIFVKESASTITSSGEESCIFSDGILSQITVSGCKSLIVAIGERSSVAISGTDCFLILGEECCASFFWYDEKNESYPNSFTTIREGENGIKAFVPYQLKGNGEVVEVQENANAE